jgi:hypothetical protein
MGQQKKKLKDEQDGPNQKSGGVSSSCFLKYTRHVNHINSQVGKDRDSDRGKKHLRKR